jgi:RNA polymerase sigma-70 factor, ECF subfamily
MNTRLATRQILTATAPAAVTGMTSAISVASAGEVGAPGAIMGAAGPGSDEVLIGRIAKRDRLAMQVLFARHVYRFVVRLIGNQTVAEDLISEVFLDVWRQAHRFEGRSAVSTWLLAIARFKALSVMRRNRNQELDEEMAGAIQDNSDGPEILIQKKDKSAALRRCLQALSPEHRQVIDLVYYHEKSVLAAAEIVGIPKATVKTRMFYAQDAFETAQVCWN